MGETEKSSNWKTASVKLKEKITENLLPDLGNERDSCISPYPCNIYGKENEIFAEWFDKWYKNNRLLLANFVPEIWREPGNEFGVEKMPTIFGDVSYIIKFKENGNYDAEVKFAGKPAKYKVML